MKNSLLFVGFLFLYLFSGNILFAQKSKEADAIIGTWLVENKEAKVQIFKQGEKYFGKIVWLKFPNYDNGEEKTDKENPKPELRKRKVLGLQILNNFVYDEDYEWEDGTIYDPKNGKNYSCNMTLYKDGKTLKVRGYIGISLIGRTQVWTKTND